MKKSILKNGKDSGQAKPEPEVIINAASESEGDGSKALDYEITADKRIGNMLGKKDDVGPQVFGATEIDLFSMETRAR